MGDQDHHTDEYLSAVKLSILTALATWWRGCYTPHTGPEAFAAMRQNEVRTTMHNHTPSSIARQPGRHRCNQIPRGRDQRTNWARAPHRTNRGGKGSKNRQEGSRQQPNKQDTSKGAQPHKGAQHKRRNTNKHTSRSPRPTTSRAQKGKARKGTKQRKKDTGRQRQHDQVKAAPEKQKCKQGGPRELEPHQSKKGGPHTTAASGSKI